MTDPKQAKLLDKSWTYYRHDDTDLERTFRRIRKQQKEAEAAKKPGSKVTALAPKKGTK